jgi:hypothetical protein
VKKAPQSGAAKSATMKSCSRLMIIWLRCLCFSVDRIPAVTTATVGEPSWNFSQDILISIDHGVDDGKK